MIFARLFRRRSDSTYLKNFLFGVEDSLVSTVGLLSGVAAAQATTKAILTTGLILIVVEGFSMGIGSFLTEETSEEIAGKNVQTTLAIKGGLTMLFSYIIAGILPLAPYAFLPSTHAMPLSIISALVGLFLLGFGTASYYHRPAPFARAFKMLLLGGLAVVIGVLIGKIFHL